MKIRILGAHNVETSRVKCMSIIIDDILALDAGGLTSSLSIEEQMSLHALLLTHYHYDHIRDIPVLGMNLFLNRRSIRLLAAPTVRDALAAHLLNGDLYPEFLERPAAEPTLRFSAIEPYHAENVAGYTVLPVPVNHAVPGTGYQVSSPERKVLFYTGDTGSGLAESWKWIDPQLLIIEVTMPSRYESDARRTGHLTPDLLARELTGFRELKGYLPRVLMVHTNPYLETEIETEAARAGKELGIPITLAREGMTLEL